jgi:outer membrane protein assembly factor BamB
VRLAILVASQPQCTSAKIAGRHAAGERQRAIDVRTHRVRWSFRVHSKIPGSLALFEGVVYVGSYGARVYALDAITGDPLWVARVDSGLFAALSTVGFYATPAIAYGRVYLGGFDGREYALDARSGKVLWARRLGGRIYSSAAVYRRTVYVGSFDEHIFYALDAATGVTRWTFRHTDGPIIGSPTVLGGLVYFSTLAHTTYALDAQTGRLVWTFPDGEYSPVVADAHRLYLVGLGRIYGLEPVDSPEALTS